MKLIGILLTWNNLEFLRCSLAQAIDFCDEVIVVEGCHSRQYPIRSTDGTVAYLKQFHKHPKVRLYFVRFRWGRYSKTQVRLRRNLIQRSRYYTPGNWIVQWDDDFVFFEDDLPRIRRVMETTEHDTIMFKERRFCYNFQFNHFGHYGVIHWDRITPGCYYKPMHRLYYKDGREYLDRLYLDDVVYHHYVYVKRPERAKARWAMSIEKGTEASRSNYERWMALRWNEPDDIFEYEADFRHLLGGNGALNIYTGPHPRIMDQHPWRHVADVRTL